MAVTRSERIAGCAATYCLPDGLSKKADRGFEIGFVHMLGEDLRRNVDHLVGLPLEFRPQLGKDGLHILGQLRPGLGQRAADLIDELRNDDAERARHAGGDDERARRGGFCAGVIRRGRRLWGGGRLLWRRGRLRQGRTRGCERKA